MNERKKNFPTYVNQSEENRPTDQPNYSFHTIDGGKMFFHSNENLVGFCFSRSFSTKKTQSKKRNFFYSPSFFSCHFLSIKPILVFSFFTVFNSTDAIFCYKVILFFHSLERCCWCGVRWFAWMEEAGWLSIRSQLNEQ